MIKQAPNTHSVSLNALMRHGGVTLQNILWRPVEEQPSLVTACSLPLTLDLLNHKSLGATSRELLSNYLPGYAQPIVVYGALPLVAPALDVEALNEMILIGNSAGIEPQLHTIRVNTCNHKGQDSSDSGTEKSFDTVLFWGGIVIGDKPLIIGAAFPGEADRDDLARDSLRHVLRQLYADQVALTDIIQSCLQLPHLARALIGADKGEIVWRNQVASSHWETHSSLIKYLAQIRSAAKIPATAGSGYDNCRRLTLVTFLRSEMKQEQITPFAQELKLSDEVRIRLSRVIEATLSEKRNSTDDKELEKVKSSAEESQVKTPGNCQNENRPESQMDFAPDSEKAISHSDSQFTSDKEIGRLAEAHRAMEIALRHLPEGGRLKLTPINDKGVLRLESFDKHGEETLDISIKDKAFPESDEIL